MPVGFEKVRKKTCKAIPRLRKIERTNRFMKDLKGYILMDTMEIKGIIRQNYEQTMLTTRKALGNKYLEI
jgi:hypothetical protein